MKRLMVVALVVGVAGACGKSEPAGDNKPKAPAGSSKSAMMAPASSASSMKKMTGDDYAKAALACLDAWSAHDAGKLGGCYADDVKEHLVDSGLPDMVGKAAVVAGDQMFWKAFSDLKGMPQTVLVNGNHVAVTAIFAGTNDGDFMGKPATKKKAGVLGFVAYDMSDDGKVKQSWVFVDFATVMAQLGDMPAGSPFAVARPIIDKGADKPEIVIAKDDATEKANVDAIAKGDDAFAKGDMKTLVDNVTDNFVESNQTEEKDSTGKAAMQKSMDDMSKMFKDVKSENMARWGAGDYVVDVVKLSMTFAPMNKPVTTTWTHLFKLTGGKVSNLWAFGDKIGWGIQLGMIPAPAMPGAAPTGTAATTTAPAAPAASSKK